MDGRLDNLVIPVDKSAGPTTYDVVRRFKKIARVDKIGHSGTLDPTARGLVLLLTGRATKLSAYLMDLPKTYVAEIELGAATDTHDAAGEIVETGDWSGVTRERLGEAAAGFAGRRTQVPPMYSALKHRGTPLYALARRGQRVERRPRDVEIYAIEVRDFVPPLFTIEVSCSRGLYVRVLAEELGRTLGVPAHLHGLVRTRIGHFDVAEAIGDDQLERLHTLDKPGFTPLEALRHLPAIELTAAQTKGVRNGLAPRGADPAVRPGTLLRLVGPRGELEAIAAAGPAGTLELRRVFAGGE